MSSAQLTPMEERILEVFRFHDKVADAELIMSWGTHYYGHSWAGKRRVCQDMNGYSSYPLLNRFLGSLAKKGLLERHHFPYTDGHRRSFGRWGLTEAGRDLLGLSSEQNDV